MLLRATPAPGEAVAGADSPEGITPCQQGKWRCRNAPGVHIEAVPAALLTCPGGPSCMGLGSAPGPVPSPQNKGLSRKQGEPQAPPNAATPLPSCFFPLPFWHLPQRLSKHRKGHCWNTPRTPPAPQPLLLRVLDSPTHAEAAGIAPSRGVAAKAPSPAAPAPPRLLLAHRNSEELGAAAAAALHGDPSSGKPLPSEHPACSRWADYS